jgi:hypothetical protein
VRAATGASNSRDQVREIYVATGPALIVNNLQSLNGRVLILVDSWKAVYSPEENKMGFTWCRIKTPSRRTILK